MGIHVVVLLLLLLTGANAFCLTRLAPPEAAQSLGASVAALASGDARGAAEEALRGGVLPWIAIPTVAPLALAVILLFVAPRSTPVPAPTVEAPVPSVPDPSAGGLRLLATLQEEARLVDFVREDLGAYSDEQVGAAVRGIHAALRKAVEQRLTLDPILAGDDGDAVEVPAGFEPALIRLIGKPAGLPPYRGILRHGGWRASEVRLPQPTTGSDPTILAPAEVEVGSE
jgi:hypothetical protein